MKNLINRLKGNLFAFFIGVASAFNIAASRLETNPQACGMMITSQKKKVKQPSKEPNKAE
ncbi:hypothetical protein KXD93_06550 [Mucilaginibacter sp. BJC16-A38]|uniref:hypothetical protein n=1 Tax=Mucilaginibacter phenanthrenivorans TaxID=1234842 RepID=UPI0021583D0A|nr:hypothetical protein [Mucilaginibacter phenanthrenivorans]MCR8557292.1 hypothetical protein [Mucilaginibacter phenanthrenivorans]